VFEASPARERLTGSVSIDRVRRAKPEAWPRRGRSHTNATRGKKISRGRRQDPGESLGSSRQTTLRCRKQARRDRDNRVRMIRPSPTNCGGSRPVSHLRNTPTIASGVRKSIAVAGLRRVRRETGGRRLEVTGAGRAARWRTWRAGTGVLRPAEGAPVFGAESSNSARAILGGRLETLGRAVLEAARKAMSFEKIGWGCWGFEVRKIRAFIGAGAAAGVSAENDCAPRETLAPRGVVNSG
jgi:hypothetical protein